MNTSIKRLLGLASFAVLSLNVQAQDIVLKKVNQNIETQACYVAATKGIKEAKSFLRTNDYAFASMSSAIKCNGMSITDFADKYAVNQAQSEQAMQQRLSQVKLVAKDNDASQICVDAVKLGAKEARAKYGLGNQTIYCNDKTLGRFVRSFEDKQVSL